MSSYPQMTAPAAPAIRRSRPGTLITAIAFAVVAGVAAIANGVIILAGGRDLIVDILINESGLPEGAITVEDLSLLEELSGVSLTDLESTLATRAYLVLIAGAALVLFGVLMHRAATWARVLVTITGPLALIFSGIVILDGSVPIMALCCLVTIVAVIVVLILTWLPPNNRYARAMR
ncbi:MAG TPA: hypothetical protein VFV67_02370 [Actinophytocola sp.]|uniref:hypothetical protein n=1 Tax=Actinophytocola sp. TaxID=1872138 RepID=UPI002DBEF12F|nr:hypothetical protein [Actinophytocola sp.]HEU5469471.1 hypothetical protein [Actinophytocola sp.]